MANSLSVNMLQINVNWSREVPHFSTQLTREVEILLISEQNRDLHDAMWFKGNRGDAAIYVYKNKHYRTREVISSNGYVDVVLGQLAIFSCYFSSNVAEVVGELDPAALEKHIQKWKGPLISAGNFNAEARAWTGGPRNLKGDLLEK